MLIILPEKCLFGLCKDKITFEGSFWFLKLKNPFIVSHVYQIKSLLSQVQHILILLKVIRIKAIDITEVVIQKQIRTIDMFIQIQILFRRLIGHSFVCFWRRFYLTSKLKRLTVIVKTICNYHNFAFFFAIFMYMYLWCNEKHNFRCSLNPFEQSLSQTILQCF